MEPAENSAWIKDKVCLITGSNAGVGKETARGLARQGARVVMVCRDQQRGEAASQEIIRDTGNHQVELMLADLASLDSVRQLAEQFKARYDSLHVLINNAGRTVSQRTLSRDGFEMTLAVNHLSHFLLTNLLLDRLKATAPARVINVSSRAEATGTIHFDDLQLAHGYSEMKAYSQSKLANVLFTYELARRLAATGVTANCLHPGLVRSDFAANSSGLFKLAFIVSRPFQISPEKGAQTSIYLATSPEVTDVTGDYFINCKPAKSSKESYDLMEARRLWEVSAELTGLAKA